MVKKKNELEKFLTGIFLAMQHSWALPYVNISSYAKESVLM